MFTCHSSSLFALILAINFVAAFFYFFPQDLFARLGPVYFFNAMCALVERRTHTIEYDDGEESGGFGMTLSGGNPVRISDVKYVNPPC